MSKTITAVERARRIDQAAQSSHHKTKTRQTTREVRRERERAGDVVIFNARETFKLDYKLSVPPGILRDDNPFQIAGTLTADSEADILRGIFVKVAEACGITRPEFGRAVTGLFAEIINPLSMNIRGVIATQIAQGTGLQITVQEITSCVDCGAEQEIVDVMLPGDDDLATQEDQTVHAPQCPTHGRPDVETIARFAEEGSDSVPPMLLGKEVEWKTGPALMILHPQKYAPLFTPPSAEEAVEITEEDADKILEFPASE